MSGIANVSEGSPGTAHRSVALIASVAPFRFLEPRGDDLGRTAGKTHRPRFMLERRTNHRAA